MDPKLRFEVYCEGEPTYADEFDGPIELGRQQTPEEPLFVSYPVARGRRAAIARLEENSVSRRHVLLEPLAEGQARVENLAGKNAIRLRDGTLIAAGESRELRVPFRLRLGSHDVQVESAATEAADLHSLSQPTILPGAAARGLRVTAPLLSPLAVHSPESVVAWLRTVTDLLQSAVSSEDFFQRAARAVVDLVGMDCGRVLLLQENAWKTVAEYVTPGLTGRALEWRPSRRILDAVCAQRKTTWREGSQVTSLRASLELVEAVVVSPILDRGGKVIGALYGDRLLGTASQGPRITPAEAMLMETLACGVAAGLARLEQERAALVARVQFEQFFSAELAQQLTLHPDLLEGRDTEVTVLFCDIRGFSAIAERLGPAVTMEWINDVMGALSDCVIRHQGVLVDYVGDELLAMWGAPAAQPDHARLACRAAIEMFEALPALNERWFPRINEATRVGIGINTGQARVGNTGSRRKFKYGPLGNSVNLASRVQGATKYLRTALLITAATQDQLDESFATRRLCQVRVINIAEPVNLYELCPQVEAGWQDIRVRYEQALDEFEQQNFGKATSTIGQLLDAHPSDGPSIALLSRAAACLAEQLAGRVASEGAVWELPSK